MTESNLDYSILKKKLRIKYILDRAYSIILLILTSPIFFIITLMIKLEGLFCPQNGGPVFYSEERYTEGRPFRILKFRTVPMHVVKWVNEKPDERSISGSNSITFCGKIILSMYLDELPQLINILKGEMSFVGPRPHIASMHRRAIEIAEADYRNYCRAGLLGIPQACKQDPRFNDILVRMSKSKVIENSYISALDSVYPKLCLKKSVFEIVVLDMLIILKCILVLIRGEPQTGKLTNG